MFQSNKLLFCGIGILVVVIFSEMIFLLKDSTFLPFAQKSIPPIPLQKIITENDIKKIDPKLESQDALGYTIMTTDNTAAYTIGILSSVISEGNDIYISIALKDSQKKDIVQKFLVYSGVDHFSFEIQRQTTQDLFPLSKQYTTERFTDPTKIITALGAIKNHQIILPITFDLPPSIKELPKMKNTLPVLMKYYTCNKLFYEKKLQANILNELPCIPYIATIHVYVL